MERATLGPLLQHTEAKHDILRYHLSAWFPILGRSFSKLRYIDGFAGPGEYQGGEPGSPIIALNAISQHQFAAQFFQGHKQFEFLFVEENRSFVNHLEKKVDESRWPVSFEIQIEHGEFETVMNRVLDLHESSGRAYPPTLLFIDPFGSSGFSMDLIARVARHPTTDILINFNYLDLVRWLLPDPVKHVTLDRLYGSDKWRAALTLPDDRKRDFLIREYAASLLDRGLRGTNFEMVNKQNQSQYFLFFATRDPKGLEVIKGAMRNVSPDGLFRYTDRSDPHQFRLMGMNMDDQYASDVADSLYKNYRGAEVSMDDLINEVIAWHPIWLVKDLRAGLRQLEQSRPSRILDVRNSDGRTRRKNSFLSGSIIQFAE